MNNLTDLHPGTKIAILYSYKVNKNELVKALAKIAGAEDVLASPRDLIAYSYDATGKQSLPDVVVFPANTAEVSAIMKTAYRSQTPVIARGAGTNLTGGTVASRGGIVLELSRLNRILEIDTARHRVVVEPGIVNLDLQNALQPLGFMYAPDPASQKSCTLGGNIGEDAGGPHCLKYGVTSNHVCGLELVLADGQVVQVGSQVDDSYGYDLLGPVVGSEGTFGIATKLVLRIMRLPESLKTMLAVFETLEDAGQAVSDIIVAGIVPASLELLDNPVIRAVEAGVHAGYPLDAEAVLLIELDGLNGTLEPQSERITQICRNNNTRDVKIARTAAERDALWQGRRGAFGAVARVRPAYACQDATVPRNKLVHMLREVGKIAQKYQVLIGNVAHAGDGNLHPLMMFDNRDPDESQRVKKAGNDILAACVTLGGTISGEHGIGLEKQNSMSLMFSPNELEAMHKVKTVFDPDDILNPGKVFPSEKTTTTEVKESKTMPASSRGKSKGLHEELVKILGSENVLADPKELAPYQVDGKLPSLVVFPADSDQICQVVRAANRYGIPLIPRGNGSKQAMGLPLEKIGVVLSLQRMNHLLELDTPNLTVNVEAGINCAELQRELAKHNLYFPLEPEDMESATIGGSLAANSSGPGRLVYGTARDLVLGVTVVTPGGEVIHAGGKTMKNVAGYDLRKLLFGSWGTLGIITQAILRLSYLPEEHKTLLLRFSDIKDASQLVRQISNSFLRPESMELIDYASAQNLEPGAGPELQEGELLLLIGIAGSKEVMERHITDIQALGKTNKAQAVTVLSGTKEKETWANQQRIHLSSLDSTTGMIRGKAVVPLNLTEDMFRKIKETATKHQLNIGITGRVGNGILYSLISPKKNTQGSEVLSAIADLVQSADKLGGFFLVESGTPEVRQAYDVISQRSDYELMKRLKQTFDPNNILNPDKIVRNP